MFVLGHGSSQVGRRRVRRCHHSLVIGAGERTTGGRRWAVAATGVHVVLVDAHGVAGPGRRGEQRGVVLRRQHARVRRVRDVAVVTEARSRRRRCRGRVRRVGRAE